MKKICVLLMLCLMMITCNKDVVPYNMKTEIKVSEIGANTAKVETMSEEAGFDELDAVLEYSFNEDFSDLKQTEMKWNEDCFMAVASQLEFNTKYYYKVVFTGKYNSTETEVGSFTTLECYEPTVTTADVTNIGETTATSGGNVTDDGGAALSARGVCWSTSQNPTISNSHTTDGNGTGSYTSNLTNLTANTTYYVRAYATNEKGTAYGEERSFTTVEIILPSVTTNEVMNINATTASCGGNVTSDGNATVTARGVCWSEVQNPTIDNIYSEETNDGSGTGTFTSYLTNLKPYTTYYVRAYATNEKGTSYGAQKIFTTLDNGHEYVDLGLPSGLKWATCNVGANSPEDYGNYYAWGEYEPAPNDNYSDEYCSTYGLGISQMQAQGYIDSEGNLTSSFDAATANWGGDWRMPTRTEIQELQNNCTWTWTTQNGVNGYKVTSKVNSNYIFLPAAGGCYGSLHIDAGSYGYYWSSSPYEDNNEYYYAFYLYFDSGNRYMSHRYRFYGKSVRPVIE